MGVGVFGSLGRDRGNAVLAEVRHAARRAEHQGQSGHCGAPEDGEAGQSRDHDMEGVKPSLRAKRRRNGAYVQYPVCEPDAWNGDFYQVRPRSDEAIVTKHRYGAFESSDLDLVLRSKGIRTVIMTGVATNVCVETTARQAFLRDYYVVFTSDGTATYSQAEHDTTLANIDNYFGQVVTCDEVAACWQPAPALTRR